MEKQSHLNDSNDQPNGQPDSVFKQRAMSLNTKGVAQQWSKRGKNLRQSIFKPFRNNKQLKSEDREKQNGHKGSELHLIRENETAESFEKINLENESAVANSWNGSNMVKVVKANGGETSACSSCLDMKKQISTLEEEKDAVTALVRHLKLETENLKGELLRTRHQSLTQAKETSAVPASKPLIPRTEISKHTSATVLLTSVAVSLYAISAIGTAFGSKYM